MLSFLELHVELYVYHVIVGLGEATVVDACIFCTYHYRLANPVVGANFVLCSGCTPFSAWTIEIVASLGIQLLADDRGNHKSIETVCLIASCVVDVTVGLLAACQCLREAMTLAVDIFRAYCPVVGREA